MHLSDIYPLTTFLYFLPSVFCGHVNFALEMLQGRFFFRAKKANKNIHPDSDLKKIPFVHHSTFFQDGGDGGDALSPLKFITEAPPLSHPPSLSLSRRTDWVPRELHFRHYCQVPLTPFFLPFYLQQLIRVPLPFSLLDDVSASLVKPFRFSESESASRLFSAGPSSLGNWGVSVKTKTLHFKLFHRGLRLEPINGRMANNLPLWQLHHGRCWDVSIILSESREGKSIAWHEIWLRTSQLQPV